MHGQKMKNMLRREICVIFPALLAVPEVLFLISLLLLGMV